MIGIARNVTQGFDYSEDEVASEVQFQLELVATKYLVRTIVFNISQILTKTTVYSARTTIYSEC